MSQIKIFSPGNPDTWTDDRIFFEKELIFCKKNV